ncbi:MAG TPA: flagellar biosynthesis protein FliQ [Bacillota bacterium]|jgi:flagellar biosynthetic protein FliQ
MTEQFIMDLGRQAMTTTLLVGAPLIGIGLLVGLVVSIFQATTQINEQTLSFAPKIAAVAVSLVVFGPWMLRVLTDFTVKLLEGLPAVIR